MRAALELLVEHGYDRLTMDGVAARVGAGKATLYRRWPDKAALVLEAVRSVSDAGSPSPDTGSLSGDLHALLTGPFGPMEGPAGRVMAGVVSALRSNPDFADSFRTGLLAERQAQLRTVFERAARRGEIPPHRDLSLLCAVGPALLFHRLCATNEPVDPTFVQRVIQDVIIPLATAPEPPRPGRRSARRQPFPAAAGPAKEPR